MPLTTFNFTPGINKDDSPLASEGGWIDGDKVRFAANRMQTIGGWDVMSSGTFQGMARGAHAWADIDGRRYAAFGTDARLYAVVGGAIRDITPLHSEGVLTTPFSTAVGSQTVTVAHPDHAFSTGMPVTYPQVMPLVGGLQLNGTYVVTVDDENTYTITATSPATSTETAGGGYVDFRAPLPAGLISATGEPGGYGTGAYSSGGYGATNAIDFLPRVWFLDSWGETLLALPRGGALYQWQPAIDYSELISNGTFDSSIGWTSGTGWSISGSAANGAAGTASQLSRSVSVRGGYVYRVSFSTTVVDGTIAVGSDGGDFGPTSAQISRSGTYSRRFRAPAGMTKLIFYKDAAFAGSLDNVSLKLESVAYRIDEAPHKNAAMFVDPHQIAVLLGTSTVDGPYNGMAVRWCDRQDITAWNPTVSNLAGDDILARGSRLVSGIASRQENMIWSDTSLYTMQYTGDATQPFMFQLAGSGCGLIGALARCEYNGAVFWVARDNFYRYAGGGPEPIPSTLRRDFFDHLADNQGEKIACGILPGYSEFWVFYPDKRDGSECSRYVAARWDEGHWTGGTLARTAWIAPGIFEHPIAFGTDGKVYYHETGTSAAGGPIEWFAESAYFDIGDGENVMFLRRIVGDFDDLQGPVNFSVFGRMWPTSAETGYGPFLHNAQTNKIDLRVSARQLKLRIGGTAAPAFARLGALRLDLIATGAKR